MAKRTNWTKEMDSFIVTKYPHIRAIDISKEMNIPVNKIRNRIKSLNLLKPIRQRIDTKACFNNKFLDIMSREGAYFLGLIWADGWIYSRYNKSYEIGLELTDKEIIYKLAEYLKCNVTIRNPRTKADKWNITSKKMIYKIKLSNLYFSNKIRKLGFIDKKKDRDYFPNIPVEYYYDFIRGYFDGDGWICKKIDSRSNKYQYEAGIVNQHDKLHQGIINFLGFGRTYKNKVTNLIKFNKAEIKKLKVLYTNCGLYIERKKDIFVDCWGDENIH